MDGAKYVIFDKFDINSDRYFHRGGFAILNSGAEKDHGLSGRIISIWDGWIAIWRGKQEGFVNASSNLWRAVHRG